MATILGLIELRAIELGAQNRTRSGVEQAG